MPRLANKERFVEAARSLFPNINIITREEIFTVVKKKKVPFPNWLTQNREYRAGRGKYFLVLPTSKKSKVTATAAAPANKHLAVEPSNDSHSEQTAVAALSTVFTETLVPVKQAGYVKFGNYSDVKSIIESRKFYPTFITGLSGNGKTMMVEQICAETKREMIRANVTKETDEDDLIGGFRLVNGATIWQNGPVITAMERGAVLLLDEVDLGDIKLMCLQPILEGKPIYIKKINKVVKPTDGFNVIATANTKGRGSDDGRFIGTNVMNEAFLERFSITFEQEYPSANVEEKILRNVMEKNGTQDNEFCSLLTRWAEAIRTSFFEGAISDLISTRRLVHIVEAYGIFGKNREKAIRLCLNRFDVDTKNSFWEFYSKIDPSLSSQVDPLAPASSTDAVLSQAPTEGVTSSGPASVAGKEDVNNSVDIPF